MSGERGELPHQLYAWAVKEMKFRPQGAHAAAPLPQADHFKSICRGQMVDIWAWVVKHMQSQQTVEKVRGNLSLHRQQQVPGQEYKVRYGSEGTYSQERAELTQQRCDLLDKLTHALSDSAHLEKDVSRLQEEIQTAEEQYKKTKEELRNTHRKSALLRSYSMKCSEQCRSYDNFTAQVREKVERLSKFNAKDSEKLFAKETLGSAVTETACSKDVRESCVLIGDFLQRLVEGKFGQDRSTMEKKKESLWQSVELVCGSHSPQLILLSLTNHALDTSLSLRDLTNSIDISREIQDLKFKYEGSGVLVDTEADISALYSLDKLFKDSQAGHIQKFFLAERSKNAAWKHGQQLSKLEEAVAEHLRKEMRVNPGALSLARKLFESELKTVILRSAVNTLHAEGERLQKEITDASRERTELYNKYQKIQTFKEIADSKQNVIRVLVKQNVKAQTNLEEQQVEIQKYIMNTLSGRDVEVSAMCQEMTNYVSKEVDAFTALMLPDLMFTILESSQRIAVADLSINKLSGHAGLSSHTKALLSVVSKLDFPLYKAPECLLATVIDLKNEVNDISVTMERHASLSSNLSLLSAGKRRTEESVAALCESVKLHDQEQVQQVLPVVQKRLAQVTQAFTDLLNIKEMVQMFWEQPAQHTTPWVKVDDLTYQQWRDKWTVAVTRLRQLQVTTT